MSLLLEALRKAEEDARKRRQAGGLGSVAGVPDLPSQGSASDQGVGAQPQPASDPPGTDPGPDTLPLALAEDDFPPLSLSPVEPENVSPPQAVVSAPAAPVASPAPPTAAPLSLLSPRGPLLSEGPPEGPPTPTQAQPPTAPKAAADPPRSTPESDATAPTRSAAPAPALSERQMKSAARIMGGATRPAGPTSATRRRQTWLLAVVAALGVGLAGFWWWVEQQSVLTPAPVLARAPEPTPTPPPEPATPPDAAPAPNTQGVDGAPPAAGEDRPPAASSPETTAAVGPQSGTLSARPEPTPAGASRATAASDRTPPSTSTSTRPSAAPIAARPSSGPSSPVARPATATPNRAAAPTAAAPAAPVETTTDPLPQEVVLTRSESSRAARLVQAHAAFEAGRAPEAAQVWREVLRDDPLQRDAWLGLAVLAHRDGRLDEALSAYRRVLRVDPENPQAMAALSVLSGAGVDPLEESRLRELLARRPQDPDLNSALARLLSAQRRWDEAQPFWFAAHAAAPDVPVHAFNLAVSLDRLRKPELAAQHYRLALVLARQRPAGFDPAAAERRLREIDAAPSSARSTP